MYRLKDSNINLENILKPTKKSSVDNKKFRKIIPITSDCMFKTLFGRNEYIKFPCKLLSYIIDISYEELLENLCFSKNETGKKYKDEKSYRNDLVVKVKDTFINIEMNNNSSEQIRDRNFDYLMRLRNDKDNNNYNPVIQINLNNYCYENDYVVRRDYAIMSNDKVLLTNKVVIIDIYLPNIKKKSYNKFNEMEKFLLIGIEEDREKALKYVGDDSVMKEFDKAVEDFSLDDDLYESYDKEWALRDQAERDGFCDGYDKGIEEGIEKGIVEGIDKEKNEVISNLLKLNYSKEDISKIMNIDIQDLEKRIDDMQ